MVGRNTTTKKGNLAVLVIDMQLDFLEYHDRSDVNSMIRSQRKVLDVCRQKDIPVVGLEFAHYGDTISEIAQAVNAVPRGVILKKYSEGGFKGSYNEHLKVGRLAHQLEGWKTEDLFLMGVNAGCCVLVTAKEGQKHGYEILTSGEVISDPLGAMRREATKEWYKANGVYSPRVTDFPVFATA